MNIVKMARFSVDLLLILVFYATYSSATVTPLSLENKLQELETKLEAKLIQFEEKMKQLETQLELNNDLRQNFKLKVTQLEAKNVLLEAKIEEQETILQRFAISLLQATELLTSTAGGSKLFLNNRETAIQSIGKSGTPRTCRELRATNSSLSSGMHWIDPDGQGVGDDPIYVYCDMSSGATSILHDTESPVDVGHCGDPGCYSRSINYNASVKQMKSLAELSTECRQSIKYDCNYAPFELNSVAYSWWNDINGNTQSFWARNNTGIHTCQCGIDGNCVDSSVKCNCDTLAPLQLVDDGVITDKNILPITRLNFGRTQLATSSGVYTLGRFECTGPNAFAGLPTSCEDLLLIGHNLNGFYSVMGPAMMESVYCDFTKLTSDAGFQKWIGFFDIKSVPVHFYVQRNSTFILQNTPIPFDMVRVNNGNAMNPTTGKFTAPNTGTYFFSFTGLVNFPLSTSPAVHLGIELYLNGGRIGRGLVEEGNTVNGQNDQLVIQSTLNLKKGDQVWLEIIGMSSGVTLVDDFWYHTHFTGFMLNEEIVASL